jgi:predicted ATP-grasp superfamily ATP-dependent carboligase
VSAPAVVVGSVGSTLSLTRSLGRHGVAVTVLGTGPSPASRSRWCSRFVDLGREPGVVGRWLEWLEREAPPGAVVLPSGDEGVELIARHRERLLARGLRLPPTSGATSLAMLDKEQTYRLARAAGIRCPRTWRVSSEAEVRAVAAELPYPCALKPVHSHLFAKHFPAVKVFVARDDAELLDAVRRTAAVDLEMLVTEIIAGADDAIWTYSALLDEDLEPVFELTRHRLRSHPVHFGNNCLAETRRDEATAREGLKLLRGIGLKGLAHAEFKRGPAGDLALIEINHRFVNVTELLRRAGLDSAVITYRLAAGEAVGRDHPWREGVRLWFPARDLRSARDLRREGSLTWPAWIASIARPRVYTPVLAADDLRPSVDALRTKLERRLRMPARSSS